MASFRKRLVDQPGFVVEVHPSLDDVDARQILRRVAKEFKGVTPWVGSSTTTYESDSGLEVLVTVLMRGDQTVLEGRVEGFLAGAFVTALVWLVKGVR